MNFQESIQVCFKKYADFNGRATRPEFWWFMLFLFVCNLVTGAISSVVALVFYLATVVPSLAATVRRLHDTNRSGWWVLIGLIPFIGWIVMIVFLAQPGEPEGSGAAA